MDTTGQLSGKLKIIRTADSQEADALLTVINSAQRLAGIAFEAKTPGVSFTPKKPSITFEQ